MIKELLRRFTSRFSRRHTLDTAMALGKEDGFWLHAPTAAGVRVSPDTALTCDAFWRGVNLICGDISSLRMTVYRREGGGKIPATTHPAYRLLRRNPNPETTWRDFCSQLQCDLLLHGNAYALIRLDSRGAVSSLQPVPALDMSAERTRSGALFYRMTPETGATVELAPRQVFHLRGLSPVGDAGLSVVSKAREAIALSLALEKYGAQFFGNGARPNTVLVHPDVPDEAGREAIRKSWDQAFSGNGRRHGTAVLFEGMKVETIQGRNDEAQFLGSMNSRIKAIANFLGVPPSSLGYDGTRTSYASLEAEQSAYLSSTLNPHLCGWESQAFEKLLTPAQRRSERYTIEFNRRALVSTQTSERFAAYNTGILGGWMSPNEVRAAENLNPIDGGDVYRQQAQMQDLAKPKSSPLSQKSEQNADKMRTNWAEPSGGPATSEGEQCIASLRDQTLSRMAGRFRNQRARGAPVDTPENRAVFARAMEPIAKYPGLYNEAPDHVINTLFKAVSEEPTKWL